MGNENTVFEWHASHNSSSLFLNGRGETPGSLMIDSTVWANDSTVLVNNRPVPANDMVVEWGQSRSECALLLLSVWPSDVWLAVPLQPDTCHLATHPGRHRARPIMAFYWFPNSNLRAKRLHSFSGCPDGNRFLWYSQHTWLCHSHRELVQHV